jgi:hypothetical protein
MIKINRLKIEIKTENGIYGVDYKFNHGLNFLASDENTCGKSSILAAIYYCLGFEEIIGGKGDKVLTSVYKTYIEDGEKVLPVLESGAYLEVFNGHEVITIFRAAKMENRKSNLVTVFFSALDDIGNPKIKVEDMYVHLPNSAKNEKGFHNFLEQFLHMDIPEVPSSDDSSRKLYLQLIFSGMLIEQKHGWADIFSGMPYLGIKEAKKRVIEFLLKLDTLENEKKKEYLRNLENKITANWENLIKDLSREAAREACEISGIPLSPKILTDNDLSRIDINKNGIPLADYISTLNEEYDALKILKPRVVDNFNQLQEELTETENSIRQLENELNEHKKMLNSEDLSIRSLIKNLEIINTDITNNKDAKRLKDLGSEINNTTSVDICPVCNQAIQDTLLPANDLQFMSIDENIRHLEAQKEMLEFALSSHKQSKSKLEINIKEIENRLYKLRRLAKSLRSDLYSTNDNFSEATIYKKIQLESEIEALSSLKKYIDTIKKELINESINWEEYLKEKSSLPKNKFTELDNEKLLGLKEHFIENLKRYGYKSITNFHEIDISKESYLPIIEDFDMKFDSSASDNIRAIWAFTVALFQTSHEKGGNHPGLLIFDEPAQHSIVTNDMKQFFRSIIDLGSSCQVIVGITVKDSETRQAINELLRHAYNYIEIKNKAFQKIEIEE